MAPKKIARVSEIVALQGADELKAKIKEWKRSIGPEGLLFFANDLEALERLIDRITGKEPSRK